MTGMNLPILPSNVRSEWVKTLHRRDRIYLKERTAAGSAMGFLKWMLIIAGILAGMFFVGFQMLQKYGYVSAVT
jgi:hypothetical protein